MYPLGVNGVCGVTGSLFVVSVAVVGVGAAVVASVPAVAAVAVAVVASCALAVVEMMLVIHDGSALSAGVVLAHETRRRDARIMMIEINFFIFNLLKIGFSLNLAEIDDLVPVDDTV